MKSLFLVSLPRSLSSAIYHEIREAVGLKEPSWTSDGEILNLDRHALVPEDSARESMKFIREGQGTERFQKVVEYLEQVTAPEGHVYKDVVQPFVISTWLPGSGLQVLRIVRELADVAYAMLQRGWFYPGNAASCESDREERLIEGLVRARQALTCLPGVAISFDDLIRDETVLFDAIQETYPDATIRRRNYIDNAFQEVRAEVLSRRQTQSFSEIEARCSEVASGGDSWDADHDCTATP